MKKITEQKQMLDDISYLISLKDLEIRYLRNTVYRYHLKYGEEIQRGIVGIPDNYSFSLFKGNCEIINFYDTHTKSNFQLIKEKLKKLK